MWGNMIWTILGRLGRLGRFGPLKVVWPKRQSMTKTTFYFRSFAGPDRYTHLYPLFIISWTSPSHIADNFRCEACCPGAESTARHRCWRRGSWLGDELGERPRWGEAGGTQYWMVYRGKTIIFWRYYIMIWRIWRCPHFRKPSNLSSVT